jgi:hypothetical protein
MTRSIVSVGLLAVVASALGRVGEEPDDQKKDLWDFQHPAARAAVLKFQKVEEAANTEYQKKVGEARGTLLSDLDAAIKETTRSGNLDEANRITVARRSIGEVDASAWPTCAKNLVILYAAYGWNDKWKDVTAKLRELAAKENNRSVTVAAINSLFGDPAFGQVKSLVVVYSYNRKLKVSMIGYEKQVTIPQ